MTTGRINQVGMRDVKETRDGVSITLTHPLPFAHSGITTTSAHSGNSTQRNRVVSGYWYSKA